MYADESDSFGFDPLNTLKSRFDELRLVACQVYSVNLSPFVASPVSRTDTLFPLSINDREVHVDLRVFDL